MQINTTHVVRLMVSTEIQTGAQVFGCKWGMQRSFQLFAQAEQRRSWCERSSPNSGPPPAQEWQKMVFHLRSKPVERPAYLELCQVGIPPFLLLIYHYNHMLAIYKFQHMKSFAGKMEAFKTAYHFYWCSLLRSELCLKLREVLGGLKHAGYTPSISI